MRLMTLNIWNYTRPWRERRTLIADLITQSDPDVVCLQEVRHDFRFERGQGQGEQIADLTGRRVTAAVAQVYWPFPRVDEGLAILTRAEPEGTVVTELTQMRDEREDENRRLCLSVVLRVGPLRMGVFNTHFSLSPTARLLNARETFAAIKKSGDGPAMLFGDLNCEPGAPPIRYLTGDLEIQGDSGDLVDCWTAVHGDQHGYTYGSFDPVRRIDYALGRNLEGRLRAIEVIGGEATNGVYPSDHMGLVVDIDLEDK